MATLPTAVRAALLVASCACGLLAGCSVRYDSAGVTRVGIGLWGFGDPPGVDWNLDWPRRDIPELPKSAPLELPPTPPFRPEAPVVDAGVPPAEDGGAIESGATRPDEATTGEAVFDAPMRVGGAALRGTAGSHPRTQTVRGGPDEAAGER